MRWGPTLRAGNSQSVLQKAQDKAIWFMIKEARFQSLLIRLKAP